MIRVAEFLFRLVLKISACPVATPPTLLMSLVHVMDLIQKITHSLCPGEKLELFMTIS